MLVNDSSQSCVIGYIFRVAMGWIVVSTCFKDNANRFSNIRCVFNTAIFPDGYKTLKVLKIPKKENNSEYYQFQQATDVVHRFFCSLVSVFWGVYFKKYLWPSLPFFHLMSYALSIGTFIVISKMFER